MPKQIWLVLVLAAGAALVAAGILLVGQGPAGESGRGWSRIDTVGPQGTPDIPTPESKPDPAQRDSTTSRRIGSPKIRAYLKRRTGPCSLTGLLRQQGSVLIGARVVLLAAHEGGLSEASVTRTDELGRFRFEKLGPGRYRIAAVHRQVPIEWASGTIEVLAGEDHHTGTLEVPKPAILRFKPVDRSGYPQDRVSVIPALPGPMSRLHRRGYLPEPAYAAGELEQVQRDHQFVLEGLVPGPYRFLVGHDSCVYQVIEGVLSEGEDRDVGEIVFKPLSRMFVQVLGPDGEPVPNAKVSLCLPEADGGEPEEPFLANDLSDVQGYSSFGSIAEGAKVWIRAEGFEPRLVALPPDRESFEVRLAPDLRPVGELQGLERLEASEVGKGFVLFGRLESNEVRYGIPVDELGGFRAPRLEAGSWQVQGFVPGYGTSPVEAVHAVDRTSPGSEAEEAAAPTTRILLPVRAVPKRVLKVVDGSGRPVGKVRLRLSPAQATAGRIFGSDRLEVRGTTEEDGTFVWVPLWPGKTHVEVHGLEWVRLAANPDGLDLEDGAVIELRRAAFMFGRITDRCPDLAMRIHAVPLGTAMTPEMTDPEDLSDPDAWRSSPIGPSGEFELGPLEPETHLLWLEIRGGIRGWSGRYATPLLDPGMDERPLAKVELGPGELASVDVEMGPMCGIEGRVLCQGEPKSGILVRARSCRATTAGTPMDGVYFDPQVPQVLSNDTGRFHFQCRNPSSWWLWAQTPGFQSGTTPVQYGPKRRGEVVYAEVRLPYSRLVAEVDMEPFRRHPIRILLQARSSPLPDSFRFGSAHLPDGFRSIEVRVPDDGRFAIEGLAAGTWELRLVDRRDRMIDYRVVEIRENDVVDLGKLETELPEEEWLRITDGTILRLENSDVGLYRDGTFVGKVVQSSAWLYVPVMEPGDYELRFRCWKGSKADDAYLASGRIKLDRNGRRRWVKQPRFEKLRVDRGR